MARKNAVTLPPEMWTHIASFGDPKTKLNIYDALGPEGQDYIYNRNMPYSDLRVSRDPKIHAYLRGLAVDFREVMAGMGMTPPFSDAVLVAIIYHILRPHDRPGHITRPELSRINISRDGTTYVFTREGLAVHASLVGIFFKVNDKLERASGPAMIMYTFGDSPSIRLLVWYKDNMVHRIDGPARISYERGQIEYEEWNREDLLHRSDGPAHISYNQGRKINELWYIQGQPHAPFSTTAIVPDEQGHKVHFMEWRALITDPTTLHRLSHLDKTVKIKQVKNVKVAAYLREPPEFFYYVGEDVNLTLIFEWLRDKDATNTDVSQVTWHILDQAIKNAIYKEVRDTDRATDKDKDKDKDF